MGRPKNYDIMVKGQTQVILHMSKLSQSWYNIAKNFRKMNEDEYAAGIYEECADQLEQHIEDFVDMVKDEDQKI